jgi:hypothetical protein
MAQLRPSEAAEVGDGGGAAVKLLAGVRARLGLSMPSSSSVATVPCQPRTRLDRAEALFLSAPSEGGSVPLFPSSPFLSPIWILFLFSELEVGIRVRVSVPTPVLFFPSFLSLISSLLDSRSRWGYFLGTVSLLDSRRLLRV